MNARPTPPNSDLREPRMLVRMLAPLGLFLAALAIRALPWPSVFTPERVLFVGTDAYYHARRILYGLVNFPRTLEFDRYINFPDGAAPIWSPLFDRLVALALWPFLDGSDPIAFDRALAWVSPLLGAATVVALYALAKRHFGFATGVLAGALLCLISGHFWYSQIGFLDHHAAEALFSVGLVGAGMKLVGRLEQPTCQRSAMAVAVMLFGIASAGCLLLWPGMLLQFALAQCGVVTALVTLPSRAAAARGAEALAAANAVSLGLVLLFAGSPVAQFGAYSPVVLSRFQPWMFAALAIQMAVLGVLWRGGTGERATTRGLQWLAIGVVVLLASAASIPDLGGAVLDASRWLFKQEHFQSSVAESRGLFYDRGGLGVRIAEARLSRFLYLFPVALAVFGWRNWRADASRAWWLIALWALGLAVVTVLQKRFFNSFSIPLALLFAWSVVSATRWLARQMPAGLAATSARLTLALVATAFLLAPMRAAYEPALLDHWKLWRGEVPERRPAGPDLSTLYASADWLRSSTPETRGYLDDAQPEYAVMALWGNGHVIEYVARRPTVTDSFGDDIGDGNFRASLRYFASESESEASAILDRLGVRYVVAESLTGGRRARDRKLMTRLWDDDGNGLSRHRLLFEALSEAGRSGGGPDHLKVFEHVAGARVRGSAPPGVRVRAELGFTTNRGRRGTYRSSAIADESGQYTLTLPYATRGGPPALLSEAAYQLRTESGAPAQLIVDEQDVASGNEVVGPSLATLPQPKLREAAH